MAVAVFRSRHLARLAAPAGPDQLQARQALGAGGSRGRPPFRARWRCSSAGWPAACSGRAWNWLASARWRYTVPFLGDVKLYEMPVLGFLGFAPFALAVFALYQFLRGLLGRPRA